MCQNIFGTNFGNFGNSTTYEGENNILIQQTSNFLISLRAKGWKSFENFSALKTVEFLKDGEEILASKWSWKTVNEALDVESE